MGLFDPTGDKGQEVFSVTIPPGDTSAQYDTPEYDGTNSDDYAENGYTGQKILHEHWYLCDRCQKPYPKSKTIRDTRAASNRGLRVCMRCMDLPARDDLSDVRSARLRALMLREAQGQSKEP